MRLFTGILFSCILFQTMAGAQSQEIVPGDNLLVQGIPKISASLADEIAGYTEFRSTLLASWHPLRREMLIRTRFADTLQIHLVKFPGGARTQLTFFKDGAGDPVYQPTQGGYFVFAKDIGGNEFFQKYRYDFSTQATTLLTDGKSRNTGGVWSNKGDQFAYGSTRRNGQDVDLRVMDPENPQQDRMVAELQGGGWVALDWSPDDRQLLVLESISINESYLWLLDVASGQKTLLTPKGETEKIAYRGGHFSRDSKGIYVTTDRESEFQRLTYLDLGMKNHHYLTDQIKWDIEEFQLSWDGKSIAFIANEDGVGVLHLLDTASGKEKTVPPLPAGSLSNLEWHRNNKDLGFVLVSAQSPADVYSWDITNRSIERWTYSETGGLNTDHFSQPELIRWKSFDGKMISGCLYRPPAKFQGKRPMIVDIHGGPEGQARPGFQGQNNYLLNELGISLIFPNIRGSSGYGKTFLKLDDGFKREDSYKDIGTLLDWVQTRPDLDPTRILVRGGSYGGHMTLAIAAFYPNRIRCALDVVGMSNLVTFLENTSPYRRDLRRVEYGDERDPKMREFLNRIAPLNNTTRMTQPLFVVQGGNDPRVPISEAEQIVATLRKNNTPVWYLMAKDEGHGFAKKKNRDFLLYSSVLFMKQYLLN